MRKRVRAPFAIAATLSPGDVYRERFVESISVEGADCVITLVGPKLPRAVVVVPDGSQMAAKQPTFAELEAPRFRPTVDRWRP